MSRPEQARRARMQLFFQGIDVTDSVEPYFLSAIYTDNEGKAPDDLQIKLQDRDGQWLTAWLAAAFGEETAADEAETAETPDTSVSLGGTVYTVTAKSGLNVRSGPGTGYAVLGLLSYGTAVTVTGTAGAWSEIAYNGGTAYVYSQHLTAAGAANASSSSGETAAVYTVTAKSGLNVRSGPGIGYSILGMLACGATVTVKGTSGAWSKIEYGSGDAYVYSQYLNAGGDTVTETAEETQTETDGVFKIRAVLIRENWNGGGKDKLLDCGEFELDSVDYSGPPNIVTLRATALPYRANIRKTERSRVWESYMLSGIANEIASAAGLACLYLPAQDFYYARVEQFQTTDIVFLNWLCGNMGLSLKATNNMLVIFDPEEYAANAPARSIRRGDGSYLKYKLEMGAADTLFDSCRVSYVTPEGRLIEGLAYVEDYDAEDEDNQQLEISAKVYSPAEALTMAEKRLRMQNQYAKTAFFSVPGDPDLVAGLTVRLDAWGPWDGKYMIAQAKHTLGEGGYTTELNLRRVLEGN